uniref:Uncharacterized protein n=1 Tax=Pyricularia oryzae (strain P131) TaxID=1143193 RepID=L7J2I9_PYRO1
MPAAAVGEIFWLSTSLRIGVKFSKGSQHKNNLKGGELIPDHLLGVLLS